MKNTKKTANKLPVPGKVRKASVSTAPLCCRSPCARLLRDGLCRQ